MALFGGAVIGALLEKQSLLLALIVALTSSALALGGYSAAHGPARARGRAAPHGTQGA